MTTDPTASGSGSLSGETIQYAGFWPRLGALLLDALVFLPLTALYIWGQTSRLSGIFAWVPITLVMLFYDVYLVKRFGGTPGKLIVGVRVRKVDGSPIGYREAILRYLPEFVFSVAINIAFTIALLSMTDAEYLSMPYLARWNRITQLVPWWYQPVNIADQVWVWGELLVLLTNRKRRALHDFIAGTIVIVQERSKPPALAALVPPSD